MIELNRDLVQSNRRKVLERMTHEQLVEMNLEQIHLSNFNIAYSREDVLRDFLDTKFDTARKPFNENGPESSADCICKLNDVEFRFQHKSIKTGDLGKTNKFDENKTTLYSSYRTVKGMKIQCTPNHTRPFYKRTDLDVMVADLWPVTGEETFLYKLIDYFAPPSESQRQTAINSPKFNFSEDNDIREYIKKYEKLEYDPEICRWMRGWTENIDWIIEKLTNENYQVRDYVNQTEKIKAEIKPPATLNF